MRDADAVDERKSFHRGDARRINIAEVYQQCPLSAEKSDKTAFSSDRPGCSLRYPSSTGLDIVLYRLVTDIIIIIIIIIIVNRH